LIKCPVRLISISGTLNISDKGSEVRTIAMFFVLTRKCSLLGTESVNIVIIVSVQNFTNPPLVIRYILQCQAETKL